MVREESRCMQRVVLEAKYHVDSRTEQAVEVRGREAKSFVTKVF